MARGTTPARGSPSGAEGRARLPFYTSGRSVAVSGSWTRPHSIAARSDASQKPRWCRHRFGNAVRSAGPSRGLAPSSCSCGRRFAYRFLASFSLTSRRPPRGPATIPCHRFPQVQLDSYRPAGQTRDSMVSLRRRIWYSLVSAPWAWRSRPPCDFCAAIAIGIRQQPGRPHPTMGRRSRRHPSTSAVKLAAIPTSIIPYIAPGPRRGSSARRRPLCWQGAS
jgi:hypothetical protein